MGFPPLHKECAVVCDARPGGRSITFHFVQRSSTTVPHLSADDLTLQVVNRNRKTKPLRPASVLAMRRMLIVIVGYTERLAKLVRVDRTCVRVIRRIRNGAETAKAWECQVVSVLTLGKEGP